MVKCDSKDKLLCKLNMYEIRSRCSIFMPTWVVDSAREKRV